MGIVMGLREERKAGSELFKGQMTRRSWWRVCIFIDILLLCSFCHFFLVGLDLSHFRTMSIVHSTIDTDNY